MALLVGVTIIEPIKLSLTTPNNDINRLLSTDDDDDVKLSNTTVIADKTKINNASSSNSSGLETNLNYKLPFDGSDSATVRSEELNATHRSDSLTDPPQRKDIDEAIEHGLKMMNDLHFVKEPSLYEMGELFFRPFFSLFALISPFALSETD